MNIAIVPEHRILELTEAEYHKIVSERKRKEKNVAIEKLWNQFRKDLKELGGDLAVYNPNPGYKRYGYYSANNSTVSYDGRIEITI